tara:strand:+ start:330 stop:1016 length:687 start_codon:yes stop_codon:yes gene_type:complete
MIPRKYCRQLIPTEECNYIENIIKSPSCQWRDGLQTVNIANEKFDWTEIKKVSETFNDELFRIIMNNLDADNEFIAMTCPRSTKNSIFSRIGRGGYYKPHIDNVFTGHYSTTVFLNDPDEYKGGELQLSIDGEMHDIKLKKGWAVTYSTGIPHQVKKVTSGKRYVSVFWTTSRIPDIVDRELYYELSKIEKSLKISYKIHDNVDGFINDPVNRIATLKNLLIQKYFGN